MEASSADSSLSHTAIPSAPIEIQLVADNTQVFPVAVAGDMVTVAFLDLMSFAGFERSCGGDCGLQAKRRRICTTP
jgi:hypothetical protein